MPNEFTLVAPCFFGTESTLSFEVRRLGAQNVQVTDGRVAFSGGAEMIAAASGLGYMILDAQAMSSSDKVIVGILVIGAVGFVTDKLFALIIKALTPGGRP